MASQAKLHVPKAGAEKLLSSFTCWGMLSYVVAVREERDFQARTERPWALCCVAVCMLPITSMSRTHYTKMGSSRERCLLMG